MVGAGYWEKKSCALMTNDKVMDHILNKLGLDKSICM